MYKSLLPNCDYRGSEGKPQDKGGRAFLTARALRLHVYPTIKFRAFRLSVACGTVRDPVGSNTLSGIAHPNLTDAQAGDDVRRSIRIISRGFGWCSARRRYWHRARTRIVQHNYLDTHWRTHCRRGGLLVSGLAGQKLIPAPANFIC